MWRIVLGNVWSRPGRSLLSILSIACGVAAVLAVSQAISLTRHQLESLKQASANRPTLEVRKNDGKAFGKNEISAVADLPSVRSLVFAINRATSIVTEESELSTLVVGVDLEQFRTVAEFKMVAGRAYEESGEVCLDKGIADFLGVSIDDSIRFRSAQSIIPVECRIVGLIQPTGDTAMEESGGLFMSLREAQKLFRMKDKVTMTYVLVDPTNKSAAKAELKASLPPEFVTRSSGESTELSGPSEAMINQCLTLAAALSVFASFFLIINAHLMNVAERQRQFSLLRLVGASVKQVRQTMIWEATFLSALGMTLGVLVGTQAGNIIVAALMKVYELRPSGPLVSWQSISLSILAVTGFSMAAVAYPAYKAGNVRPLTAMRRGHPLSRRSLVWCGMTGMACLGFSAIAFAGAMYRYQAPANSVLGLMLFILGSTLLVVASIRWQATYLSPPLVALFPAIATVARQQLLDNFGRTAITVAVIFMVSTTSLIVGNTVINVKSTVNDWFTRTVNADFLLSVDLPVRDPSSSQPLPEDIASKVESIPGIASVERITFTYIDLDGTPALLMVRDLDRKEGLPIIMRHAPNEMDVKSRLRTGQILLGSVLANRIDYREGNSVELEVEDKKHQMKVAGICEEYSAAGLIAVMDRQASQSVLSVAPTHFLLVRSLEGNRETLGIQLQELAKREGLIFKSYSDFRQVLQTLLTGVTTGLWLIIILSLALATFGIGNTLMMNIVEQTRWFGLLRVAGMTRSQGIIMFMCQAVFIGGFAILPALLVAACMSCVMSALFEQAFGHVIPMTLHLELFGGFTFVAALMVLLSALLTSARTALLKPFAALKVD